MRQICGRKRRPLGPLDLKVTPPALMARTSLNERSGESMFRWQCGILGPASPLANVEAKGGGG